MSAAELNTLLWSHLWPQYYMLLQCCLGTRMISNRIGGLSLQRHWQPVCSVTRLYETALCGMCAAPLAHAQQLPRFPRDSWTWNLDGSNQACAEFDEAPSCLEPSNMKSGGAYVAIKILTGTCLAAGLMRPIDDAQDTPVIIDHACTHDAQETSTACSMAAVLR